MPNVWTHMLFCEDVIDTIGNPNPFPKDEHYMNLGAQGPDPFFYYNFWPWIKQDQINNIGKIMHQKNCGTFLLDFICHAKGKEDHVKAYVFGFVTHHILDRNTHPFIHYFSGYEGNKHQKLEVIIDTILMEKHKSIKTWKVPAYKEVNVGNSIANDLLDLLLKLIGKHYPDVNLNSSDIINKSYRDMLLALRLLNDPYRWKNILLKPWISSYSHQPVKENIDYLNSNKNIWYHSATNEPSTKSFIDLYEHARIEAAEIMSVILNYWKHNSVTKQHLQELLGDISYDTGLDVNLNVTNKYSNPIV